MCVLRPAAFVGGTLFTVGAYFGILEALNVDHEVFFGYHVRRHLPHVLCCIRVCFCGSLSSAWHDVM